MYEKYGEFDSVEEINRYAAEQKEKGDREGLKALALENGIEVEDAEDFMDGEVPEFATPLMAAYGKLKIEAEKIQPYEIMEDWITYIKLRCAEEPKMAAAVRKKGKSLKGCIAEILKWSMENAKPVDEEILKKCKITYKVTLGIPGIGRAKDIITKYYMEGLK